MIEHSLDIMTPILLAALGGLFTELAGSLAICLEGFMAFGALAGAAAATATGSAAAGMAAGALAAALIAWAFAAFAHRARTNLFISALAVNLLAYGGASAAAQAIFGTSGAIRLPASAALADVGAGAIAGHDPVVFLSWLLVPACAILLGRTRFGLRLRAAGDSPETLSSRGVDPVAYRVRAYAIAGLLCGAAGAWLSLSTLSYMPGIASGRGWIALVAVYLGFRRPFGILVAAFGFALAEYLANLAQSALAVPGTVLLALPYVVTLVAYSAYSAATRKRD